MAVKVPGRFLVGGILTLALLASAAATIYRECFHLKRFGVLREGTLYRCAQMHNDATMNRLLGRTAAKTVICLRSEAEYAEDDWLERERRLTAEAGAELVLLPMDYDTPPSREQIQQFLAVVDDPARRPVVFHCEVGAIRTGLMAAAWRIERDGWRPADALSEYESMGDAHTLRSKRTALRQWIADYRPQFPLTPSSPKSSAAPQTAAPQSAAPQSAAPQSAAPQSPPPPTLPKP